jgi:hypothetical protein
MLYTAARYLGGDYRDWINYSTSSNGISWTPANGSLSTEIVMNDPNNIARGPLTDIARPSLVKDGELWRLWFDAKVSNGAIHSFYAEGTALEPTVFTVKVKYFDIAAFPLYMEPDVVKRPDGTFLAVFQRNFNELHVGTSSDGIHYTSTAVIDADHPLFKRTYISNPGLVYDHTTDRLLGLAFGMTSNSSLVDHDIGFSAQHYVVQVRSPGDVWNTYAQANTLSEKSLSVYNFTQFNLLRLTDPVTGTILHEQDFTSAVVGDRWSLQIDPSPTPTATLTPTPTRTPTEIPFSAEVEGWELVR